MGYWSRKTWSAGLVAMFAIGAAACGSAEDATYAQPAPAGMMVMTDPMVADVFTAANDAEIEQSQLALNSAQDQRVRDYAQRMIDDHSAANDQVWNLVSDAEVRAAGTSSARQLRDNSRQTVDALRTYEGEDFDRTYMESQVALHRHLLEVLDNTLIPGARSGDVERLMVDTRATVAEHLRMAEDLHASL